MPGFDKYQFRKILFALVPALKITSSGINYTELTGYLHGGHISALQRPPAKIRKVLTLTFQSRLTDGTGASPRK